MMPVGPSSSRSCFAKLREAVAECLIQIGAPAELPVRGVTVLIGPSNGADGQNQNWSIPFFAPPVLDDLERVIIETISAAGGPLQQKEIAARAKVSIRLIQRVTPRLQDRGLLLRHPSQGFYLPGMAVSAE